MAFNFEILISLLFMLTILIILIDLNFFFFISLLLFIFYGIENRLLSNLFIYYFYIFCLLELQPILLNLIVNF